MSELLHLLVFLKRRSDMTEQQMYDYWEYNHAPLVAPWAIKHRIQKYTLVQVYLHPNSTQQRFFCLEYTPSTQEMH